MPKNVLFCVKKLQKSDLSIFILNCYYKHSQPVLPAFKHPIIIVI